MTTPAPQPSRARPTGQEERSDMDPLQHEITTWATETFPDQTDERVLGHLGEEMDELILALVNGRNPVVEDAIADCLILLLCLASRHGISAEAAVRTKHAINQNRQWQAAMEER